MRLKAVVFDLDGTLIDSRIDYEKMSGMIKEVLLREGIASEHLSDRRKISQIIRGGDSTLAEMGIGPSRLPALTSELEHIMNQIELEGVHLSKPMRNAEETLKRLRKRGLKIGIATRGCREYAVKSIALLDLGVYVDKCIARDEVKKSKPNPQHLLEVLHQLGVEPAEVFYVGDTPTDLDTARAAGILFIGYKRNEEWGKRLLDAGCERIVEDLLELVDIAENF